MCLSSPAVSLLTCSNSRVSAQLMLCECAVTLHDFLFNLPHKALRIISHDCKNYNPVYNRVSAAPRGQSIHASNAPCFGEVQFRVECAGSQCQWVKCVWCEKFAGKQLNLAPVARPSNHITSDITPMAG